MSKPLFPFVSELACKSLGYKFGYNVELNIHGYSTQNILNVDCYKSSKFGECHIEDCELCNHKDDLNVECTDHDLNPSIKD